MEILKKYIIPFLVVVFSLLAFSFFKIVPRSNLWKGFSVFYVPVDSDLNQVSSVLSENGIDEFISMKNQKIPLSFPESSPEFSLAASYGLVDSDYLEKRSGYFFDKKGDFSVFYIPENNTRRLSKVSEILKTDYGISSGVDANSSYPVAVPVVSLLFAIFLIAFSEKRFLSFLHFVLPICFSYFVPLYTSAASSSLVMYAIFLYLRFWKRRNGINVLLKNIVFSSFVILSLILEFFSGVKPFLLFVVLLFSLLAFSYLVSNLEALYERKRYSFVPVKIIGSGMLKASNKRTNFCLLPLSALLFLIFVFSVSKTSFGSKNSNGNVFLPSASSFEKSLPDLKDYVDWKWQTEVYPYVSLNSDEKKPGKGETVFFSRYNVVDGKITEYENIKTYDKNFESSSIESIEEFDFPSIEKVLKKQNRLHPGFSSSGNMQGGFFSSLLILVSVLAPLFFYLFFYKNTKRKEGAK